MTSHPIPGPRLGPFGDRTFAVLFAAAYVALLAPLLVDRPLSLALATTAAGAAYVLVGTLGFAHVERRPRAALAAGYFGLQLALGALVAFLAGDEIGAVLLLLLLCGQAVRILLRRWMVVAVALAVTFVLLFSSLPPDRANRLSYGVGILAAAFFLVAFAQVAVGEQRQRAALDRAHTRLRAYAAEVEQMATVQERNRLAREIHDGLGHYLTVVNMQIEGARAVLPHDRDRAERMLAHAQTLARETLADVRHSVAALRTGQEERPLPEALAALVAESTTGQAGPSVDVEVRGRPRPLPPQVELALYRAAQEGLTNVRKHAAASRVEVVLDYGDPSRVCLAVRDDGRGAASTNGGFGLLGLRERVGLLGGTVAIGSAPGAGLELVVTVETPT